MDIKLKNKLYGYGLHLLGRLAAKTAHIEVKGLENIEAYRTQGKPLLWAMWHGLAMLFVSFYQQQLNDVQKAAIMIPDDWRGETLAQWIKLAGFKALPMNLEDRGVETARRFAQLVHLIRDQRYDTIITPDGPAGPAFIPKPGLTFLSKKAAAPIVPVGAFTNWAMVVNRWDAYTVPYPFARICLVIGPPYVVPAQATEEESRETLINLLHRATMQAKANYYAPPVTP